MSAGGARGAPATAPSLPAARGDGHSSFAVEHEARFLSHEASPVDEATFRASFAASFAASPAAASFVVSPVASGSDADGGSTMEASWLSFSCLGRKESKEASAPSQSDHNGICPAGHELIRTSPGAMTPCSNCSTPVEVVMFCSVCSWGICSKCHIAMCSSKPQRLYHREKQQLPPEVGSKAGPKASAGVTLILEMTLSDLREHNRGLKDWFDDQLHMKALDKGVRLESLPLLEQHVEATDAKGRIYESYEALMKAGIDEEAFPIVFKFDTELVAKRVSRSLSAR